MQKIELIRAEELPPTLTARWDQILGYHPSLDNPFLRSEFTRAVAMVRNDVEVAILEVDHRVDGFFAFQRGPHNVGQPVGGHVCNQQALVAGDPDQWSPKRILQECRLASWNFDNLVTEQAAFRPFYHFTESCGFADLSRGFDDYVAERRQASKHFAEIFRKERKLERERGQLRFECRTDDIDALERLLTWKAQQCRQIKTFNLFGFDWTRNLLSYILQHNSAQFSALVSTLYVDDVPIAITYDLTSESAADGWLMAYNPEFANYSPGLICILRKVEALAARRIQRFYLGRGEARFKALLCSSSVCLGAGSVDLSVLRHTLKRNWTQAREWLRTSPFRRPARALKSWMQPLLANQLELSTHASPPP